MTTWKTRLKHITYQANLNKNKELQEDTANLIDELKVKITKKAEEGQYSLSFAYEGTLQDNVIQLDNRLILFDYLEKSLLEEGLTISYPDPKRYQPPLDYNLINFMEISWK